MARAKGRQTVEITYRANTNQIVAAIREMERTNRTGMASIVAEIEKSFGSYKRLKDTINTVSNAVSGFRNALGMVQSAWNMVSGLIDEAAAEDSGIRRLGQAFEVAGLNSASASRQFEQFASNAQNVTRFADDQIREIGQMFTAQAGGIELSVQRVIEATRLIMDISEATGRDTSRVTRTVIEAYNGETSALEGLVPSADALAEQIEELNNAQDRSRLIIDALNRQYADYSENLSDNEQQQTRVRRSWENLKESAGRLLGDAISPLIDGATATADAFDRVGTVMGEFAAASLTHVWSIQNEGNAFDDFATGANRAADAVNHLTQTQIDAQRLRERYGVGSARELLARRLEVQDALHPWEPWAAEPTTRSGRHEQTADERHAQQAIDQMVRSVQQLNELKDQSAQIAAEAYQTEVEHAAESMRLQQELIDAKREAVLEETELIKTLADKRREEAAQDRQRTKDKIDNAFTWAGATVGALQQIAGGYIDLAPLMVLWETAEAIRAFATPGLQAEGIGHLAAAAAYAGIGGSSAAKGATGRTRTRTNPAPNAVAAVPAQESTRQFNVTYQIGAYFDRDNTRRTVADLVGEAERRGELRRVG